MSRKEMRFIIMDYAFNFFLFDSTIELNLIFLLLIFCAVWIFLIWWKYGHLCF